MLDGVKVNQMKVNHDKFQYIVFCRNKTISDEYISVRSNEIMSSSCVKVLGVYFDQKLIFDYQVDEFLSKGWAKAISVRTFDKDT